MSDIAAFLPWQLDIARNWLGVRERFAHAWLVHGLGGIGKKQFVRAAAASLLCDTPQNGLACGACQACRWVAAGSHPDLRLIRPDALAVEEGGDAQSDAAESSASSKSSAPSRDIRVDQLRGLEDWFNTATHKGGWRVAVLYPSEALNVISANALLKVLEEPPAHTIFLLTANAPDRLLPTLVSRCRRLPLPVPPSHLALQWLAEQGVQQPEEWLAATGGAPVQALALAESGGDACPDWLRQLAESAAQGGMPNVAAVADALEGSSHAEWIDLLQRYFVDLMLAAADAPVRYFPALAPYIQATSRQVSRTAVADTARWLAQQRAVASHPLNSRLLVDTALQRVGLAIAAAC